MTDLDKFAIALDSYITYIREHDKCSNEDRHNKYVEFQNTIENLNCNDFRYYFYRAHYLNGQNRMDEARYNIDKAVNLTKTINNSFFATDANSSYLFAPTPNESKFLVELPPLKKQIADVYSCAGEIYAKTGDEQTSLKYYQIAMYYDSFLKSEFETQRTVTVFSFRRFNEYSLSDLINNTITVSPSVKMNDPLDSIINLWGDENKLANQCEDKKHLKPMCASFNYYRIRAFCLGKGNSPIKNILMWSHYAGEHTGFCIKYKLSNHFITQEENQNHEHMYLKKISYTNKKIDISVPSINSNLAFATKKLDWKYEHEVRLIVYNPNKEESFYGVTLDNESEIDSIFFGYRCPDTTINTIKNIFKRQTKSLPKFYKMTLDDKNIYKLKYIKI